MPLLARIYNHYVAGTCVTFETELVAATEMALRMAGTAGDGLPWLVACRAGEVAGYAYASKWKGRCAYRYTVEVTVYLDPAMTGQGIGRPLYAALVEDIRARGMHAAIGAIALPNDPSIRLHERLGFRKVAHFEQVGFKKGRGSMLDIGSYCFRAPESRGG